MWGTGDISCADRIPPSLRNLCLLVQILGEEHLLGQCSKWAGWTWVRRSSKARWSESGEVP